MRIILKAAGYFKEDGFSFQTADMTDLPLCVTDAARKFGKQWTNHFAGTQIDATIMAAFAIGVRMEGGKPEPVTYQGADIIADVVQ